MIQLSVEMSRNCMEKTLADKAEVFPFNRIHVERNLATHQRCGEKDVQTSLHYYRRRRRYWSRVGTAVRDRKLSSGDARS